MQLRHPSPLVQKALIICAALVGVAVAINPIDGVDILLVTGLLLLLGHVYLEEQLILALLLLRPALDYFRDWQILTIREAVVNMNAALAVFTCVWLGLMLIRHRRQLRQLPLLATVSLLTLLTLASALWSISPLTTIIETIKFINLAGLFFVTYIFAREKIITLPALLKTIALSAVIPLLFGLGQILARTGITTFDIQGRIYGTFAQPNVFAFFVLFLLILHTHYSVIAPLSFWQTRRGLRTFTFITLITLLLFTYTRAGFIGFVIWLLVIGVLQYHRLAKVLICSLVLFYLIFYPLNRWLIATYNYSLTSIPLIGRITATNEDSDSVSWRLALLRETTPIIRARPILGYGYGTFPIVWESERGRNHLWDDSAESHNDYLRLALETGIVGLALYVVMLGGLLIIIIKKMVRSPHDKMQYLYLFAWVVTFIAINASDNMLHHTPVMWLMWSWWGAALGASGTPRSPNFLKEI